MDTSLNMMLFETIALNTFNQPPFLQSRCARDGHRLEWRYIVQRGDYTRLLDSLAPPSRLHLTCSPPPRPLLPHQWHPHKASGRFVRTGYGRSPSFFCPFYKLCSESYKVKPFKEKSPSGSSNCEIGPSDCFESRMCQSLLTCEILEGKPWHGWRDDNKGRNKLEINITVAFFISRRMRLETLFLIGKAKAKQYITILTLIIFVFRKEYYTFKILLLQMTNIITSVPNLNGLKRIFLDGFTFYNILF